MLTYDVIISNAEDIEEALGPNADTIRICRVLPEDVDDICTFAMKYDQLALLVPRVD